MSEEVPPPPADIDLAETASQQFRHKDQAEAETKRLKELLPEVPSVYRPSGRFSANSLVWLALGAALAVGIGPAVGVALDGAAIGIWKSCRALDGAAANWPGLLRVLPRVARAIIWFV